MTRIGDDAAVAESARAELHAAAIPAEDAAIFDQFCGFGAGFFESCEAGDFNAIAGFGDGFVDLGLRCGGAEKRNGEAVVADSAIAGAAPESGAERGAVVAGCGLDVDVVEDAGLQEAAVGGAVESDAASHGESAQAG